VDRSWHAAGLIGYTLRFRKYDHRCRIRLLACFSDADANAYAESNPNAYAESNTNADAYAESNTNAYADSYAESESRRKLKLVGVRGSNESIQPSVQFGD
jgi:hypothetical protein